MKDHYRATVRRLVDRLVTLEKISVEAPDDLIVEVARAAVLDAIAAVSDGGRDGDCLALPAHDRVAPGPSLFLGWPAAPPEPHV